MTSEASPVSLPARDRAHLDRAVELGRKGWGRVHPNPMVGCVIVREGEVVGEGWHEEFGGSHAEAKALAEAGERARGATAYVSLEPCRHKGKTPPCTRALARAGVARVVFGAADPGSETGGGAAELEEAGVEVVGPVLASAGAKRENPAFFHDDPARPWTALKLAVSVDGKIAAGPGERTDLSGPEAREEVHRLRAGFDAIVVGTTTALVDDPLLTVRGPISPRVPPVRIVVDARGRLPRGARLLREGKAPVWILTGPEVPEDRSRGLEDEGARVLPVHQDARGRLDPAAAMRVLRDEGVGALLCEGGGVLGAALLGAGLVDRLYLVMTPRFLGPRGVPAFPDDGDEGWDGGEWRADPGCRRVGDDLWLTLDRRV